MPRTTKQMARKNEIEQARYQRNKGDLAPSLAEKQRKRRAAMTEAQREQARARNREARRKDTPELRMLYSARSRASARGLHFSLVPGDIVVPTHCPVLGVLLERSDRVGYPRENPPSLDRIDPARGYVKDNIAVISYRANRLKNNGTADEHEAIARFMRSRA